jgi:hypothetical protein
VELPDTVRLDQIWFAGAVCVIMTTLSAFDVYFRLVVEYLKASGCADQVVEI